ncbi:MAG: helix-turn-helix transcriptional regulator [Terriglobia bacterium]
MAERLRVLLISLRSEARLRQIDLAERLGKPQSFVSKYENGERRLDLAEVYSICKALNISFVAFAERLEKTLK